MMLSAVLVSHSLHAATSSQPNILFILADDLGWSDLACYGNPFFETPNLDQLAEDGVRFTQAYAPAPICSASRASYLTGKTTARLGFEFVTKNEPGYQPNKTPLRAPPFTLNLPLEEVTIPEVLKPAGYETAFFGKWHLNSHYQGKYLAWSPEFGPRSQGFDTAQEDFGAHPYSYGKDKEKRSFLNLKRGDFPTDSMNQRAIRFMKRKHDKPFFLMVSHFHVHTPIHTRVKWLHDQVLESIPANHPRRAELAHYGSMVTTLDHEVGLLLKALEESGHRDNTLVIFTSDNGGHPEFYGNAPLRGSKWNLYEGGIRVPFMASWPGQIPEGETCKIPVVGYQLLATFAEVAGASVPEGIDGKSVAGILKAPLTPHRHQEFLWHFPYYHPEKGYDKAPGIIGVNDGYTSRTTPMSALRAGQWKVLYFHEEKRYEVYDLSKDPHETSDLSKTPGMVVGPLKEFLQSSLRNAGARLPEPHPDWPQE